MVPVLDSTTMGSLTMGTEARLRALVWANGDWTVGLDPPRVGLPKGVDAGVLGNDKEPEDSVELRRPLLGFDILMCRYDLYTHN